MGSILTWIIWVIRYAPTIIALVKAIVEAIRGLEDKQSRAGAALQFDQAMRAVKDTGDLDELQNLGRRLGVGERIKARREARRNKRAKK